MTTTIQNILYVVLAGVLVIAGVFLLRFAFKFAWKFVRMALILLSLLLIAGYFLGFLDIGLR